MLLVNVLSCQLCCKHTPVNMDTCPTKKRKHTSHTLDFKMKLLKEVDNKLLSKTEICKKHGISPSTLSTFLKKRHEIEQAYFSTTFQPERKRMRRPDEDRTRVETALLTWFSQARAADIPISGPLIANQAVAIAQEMGVDFEPNPSWIQRFKERNGITFKTVCGEAASVSNVTVISWKDKALPALLENYHPQDVFNADETGLFYRCLPNKTHSFKGDKCSGGKKSKERVTLLLAANMTGTEKLPALVIGKSKQPRCFKKEQFIPVAYQANKNSWMTSVLFVEWLQKLNHKMKMKNRKILMFIDNCPAHPQKVELSNIQLAFFPPNCTSILQPLDQGVIQSFKSYYRKIIMEKLIRAYNCLDDKDKLKDFASSFNITLLEALFTVRAAWKAVDETTIANCFRHAGFGVRPSSACTVSAESDCPNLDPQPALESGSDADDAFNTEFQRAIALFPDTSALSSAADFKGVDDNIATTAILSSSELAQCFQSSKEQSEDEEDEEEEEVKEPTLKEVDAALTVMRNFSLCVPDCHRTSMFDIVDKLHGIIQDTQQTRKKQTTLTSFFC